METRALMMQVSVPRKRERSRAGLKGERDWRSPCGMAVMMSFG